jgi:hypothetical protein
LKNHGRSLGIVVSYGGLINMILHTFGWAIAVDITDGKVTKAYPARVKYRGFGEKNNTDGYIKVSKYLKENADELEIESRE